MPTTASLINRIYELEESVGLALRALAEEPVKTATTMRAAESLGSVMAPHKRV